MTDEQFNNAMERLRNREKQADRAKEALKEIYEEYSAFIYHVILDVVGTRENAEDITSDFFIKLWEKAGQYKPGNGHRGYLATIARNMAIDHIRKYRKELGVSQEKFAEMCGLHRTYISDIERFQRSISLENIQKIADALGIETYLLFVEDK